MQYIDQNDRKQYGAIITGPAIITINVEGALDASLVDLNGNLVESAFLNLMDQINPAIIKSNGDHISFTIWILTPSILIILHYDRVQNLWVMQPL